MAIATTPIDRNAIKSAILKAKKLTYLNSGGWVHACLYPDAEIKTDWDTADWITRDEFNRVQPHPVTFFRREVRPDDYYGQWAEGIEGFSEAEIDAYLNALLADMDVEYEIDEAVSAIEDAGYTVEAE
jgi:hypothetical protein